MASAPTHPGPTHPGPTGSIRLGVNVDHVATLRNARGGRHPDVVRAARMVIGAGADNITAHLREDRRHIRDADMRALREAISVPLNFEMAATPEMVAIASDLAPHAACLVPERREEVTTEGGLDVTANRHTLAPAIQRLRDAGIRVSLFVDPVPDHLRLARELGAQVVELHTGPYCDAVTDGDATAAEQHLARLTEGAAIAHQAGLEVHGGHGLAYDSAGAVAAIPEIVELNIGHFLMGEALFTSLEASVSKMKTLITRASETGDTIPFP